MPELSGDYVTASEAATLLGVPLRTVRYRLERGLMQGVAVSPRLWLIPRAEVERWQGQGKLRPGRKPRSKD